MSLHLKTTTLVLATLLPTTALADWTGGYAGLSVGSAINNELSAEEEGVEVSFEADSTAAFGIFGGYQVQNGDFVFGGEVALSRISEFDVEIDGEEFTGEYDVFDLKGRAGFAVDNFLIYGVAGFSRVTDEEDADGFGFGVGADFDLGNNFVVGAEYFARRTVFDDDDIDVDVDLDTFSVRGALTF